MEVLGSGVKPSYGAGGRYYAGGATQPYRAGTSSIGSGIVPGLFFGSALGFWGAYWLAGAYHYPYAHPYTFYNQSLNQNETKPVECLCKIDEECGCEDNSSNSEYMSDILGNGSYAGLNQAVITVASVNGTDIIFINGTLANGTTASGGTEDANAAGGRGSLLGAAVWRPLAATALVLAYYG
ncbi:hypothetical protein KJ359_001715 [Pestalotiopsis sp. 9143b]|nr:hypothetical protein KJ359_001715 [Pestalotiopsis sp. 9143b]